MRADGGTPRWVRTFAILVVVGMVALAAAALIGG